MNHEDSKIKFYSNWIFIVSVFFAFQSLTWIFIGSFDPYGIYDSWLADSLFASEQLSATEKEVFRFGVGLLGATTCAFFVLYAFIARIPFRNGERWSHIALTAGIVTWFSVDSAFSFYVNAYFNILFVNIPCLLVILFPLGMTIPKFHRNEDSAD